MITFKKIRFRNFLSTGNQFTEIDFVKSKTTLVMGTNGSGKSTLLDALCFVLFNKAFRKINKGQLVNTTNEKDCVVEIEFNASGYEWIVRRGIKPNLFEIYKNGVILDQLASSNDQQEWMEKNVLKLNYKSFTQIVILGSASFVPFMQLSTANRREIVEDLLDIKIFSSMNALLKEKIKILNDKIKDYDTKIGMTNEKIVMQENFIKTLETNNLEEIEKRETKIKIIDGEIEILEKTNIELLEKISEKLQPELENLSSSTKKANKLKSLRIKIQEKINNEEEFKSLFHGNTICPTCTQNLEESFRVSKIAEQENKISTLNEGLSELTKSIEEEESREQKLVGITNQITKINNEVSKNNYEIVQNSKRKKEIEQEIQKLNSKNKDSNNEYDALEKLKKQLFKFDSDRTKYKELNSYYTFSQTLLKDGGVKGKIIQKYLPLMNQLINKYLQMMDFYVNFTLDEEFNENIKSAVYEDFTYQSFSEGEKMRINLALLFTWREIARMKNSVRTNLLILDEVFDSSLDGSGIEYFSKIIRYTITDANILVISHKTDEMLDLFDSVLKVEKIKGFSKVTSQGS